MTRAVGLVRESETRSPEIEDRALGPNFFHTEFRRKQTALIENQVVDQQQALPRGF